MEKKIIILKCKNYFLKHIEFMIFYFSNHIIDGHFSVLVKKSKVVNTRFYAFFCIFLNIFLFTSILGKNCIFVIKKKGNKLNRMKDESNGLEHAFRQHQRFQSFFHVS